MYDVATILKKVAAGELDINEAQKVLAKLERSRVTRKWRRNPVKMPEESFRRMLVLMFPWALDEDVNRMVGSFASKQCDTVDSMMDDVVETLCGQFEEETRQSRETFQKIFIVPQINAISYAQDLAQEAKARQTAAYQTLAHHQANVAAQKERPVASQSASGARNGTEKDHTDAELETVLACVANEDEALGSLLISVKTGIKETRLTEIILPKLVESGKLRVEGSGRSVRYSSM